MAERPGLPLPRGLLAGIVPHATYRSQSVQLHRGELLFAYTDGLSEAEDGEGRSFGINPCRDLLIQAGGAPLPVILDQLRESLSAFSGGAGLEDDGTLLLRLP